MKIQSLFFIVAIIFALPFNSKSQTLTTDPQFPVASQSVTLTFDATGTDLAGETTAIYAHTGVSLDNGSVWQHVIGSWGNNTNQPQLTKVSANIYTLDITPTVNDFYSVTGGENVDGINIVFRNAAGDKQTSDLYAQIYSETNIFITNPDSTKIYSSGDNVQIDAVALYATSMSLYVNNNLITTVSDNSLSYTYTASQSGVNEIKITATDGSTNLEKLSHFFVRATNTVQDLPSTDLKDGINYIDDNTVTLVLYAPLKDFVFVKGSFDNWAVTLDNQMKQTTDGKRYWITLTGLTAGQEYLYQYIIDGDLVVADAYCDKILDPWNDQYISNTTYPNLIDYPSDKTSGIVSVFQTAQTPYNWQVPNFTRPAKKDLVIYETHIRDFTALKNYQTMIDTINYFKNLGVNAIELMPINEFEGNDSWGYNPDFYFAPDKAYGTKDKLKEFIDVCHQNNIAVILDMVLNHSYGLNPMVQMYFDPDAGEWGQPSADNPWFNEVSPNSAFAWGSDFNHESVDTQNFVDRVNSYWLTEFNVDGFRFDFTKGFTNTSGDGWAYDQSRINILKRMANQIWAVDANAYIILEHFTDNSEEKNLANYGMMIWGNLNNDYLEAAMGYTSNLSWISYKSRGWDNPNLVGYMESHDEERMMFKNLSYGNSSGDYNVQDLSTALKRAELAAAFFFTVPGPKMIWQFEELGYDVSIEDPCRVCAKPIHWEYNNDWKRHRLAVAFKEFINLKKNYPVFGTDDFAMYTSGFFKQIVLNHTDMDVLIAGNFDVSQKSSSMHFTHTGTWYDYVSGNNFEVTDAAMTMEFAPGEYHIYSDAPLSNSQLPVDTYKNSTVEIQPNPTNDFFTINNTNKFDRVSISNITGQKIAEYNIVGKESIKISLKKHSKGLYFVTVTGQTESITKKVIKN